MGDPTREAAFDLLSAVLGRRRPLEEALDALPPMEARDRAAAHRLAAAVLRRSGTLDAVLEQFLQKAPPPAVRHLLRLGAAGLLLLETPPHAAVSTGVALARSRGLTAFAPLVNAVLRRVAATGAAALTELDAPRLDTPAWLWSSWGADARAIAEAHQHEAPLDLTLAPGAAAPPGGEPLPTGSVRFPPGTRPAELPGYGAGLAGSAELSGGPVPGSPSGAIFWVQDAAAALPARLLAPQRGERIADLCAAPGGKTAQLAAAGAAVTAVDRDPVRLARLRQNIGRLRLSADLVQSDAASWTPPAPLFDAVILDAPCSATGTIRRHPDVVHLKRPREVGKLAQQQDRLLAAAAAMLRPGGRLIYAVCSLQPEEGAARAAAALERLPLREAPFSPDELPGLPEAITPEGHLRTHPGLWPERGGMDGFFAARFVRP